MATCTFLWAPASVTEARCLHWVCWVCVLPSWSLFHEWAGSHIPFPSHGGASRVEVGGAISGRYSNPSSELLRGRNGYCVYWHLQAVNGHTSSCSDVIQIPEPGRRALCFLGLSLGLLLWVGSQGGKHLSESGVQCGELCCGRLVNLCPALK